ncbi:hypothetical protein MLD38_023489 [Melastoma candidum]|uniref:Uncharacterized protein n=1 Tax=Melastoma candidum TaxID=119954 RepID=A0ACB9NPL0_9MYRT|nr:hypothetical protein MLD38_023489 [Melastoma candidum]
MLEDQVAFLLQRYLGNYVRGLNKEALKISVWKGDVELTNMQLKPEALNALNLPVKVKAGFLGSVKLKVPWSRLGQDPVVVHLDRIFLLAEPATKVEGSSEDAVEETKRSRVREMEMKLLEKSQQLKSEVNKSWLGSLINTIIGNLKLSISNIHIRYEDLESNPGHPFAAGVTLEKLIAVTVDDNGKETFVTGGALDRIQKSVELERIALYLDSDIASWHLDKEWKELLPSEWVQVFRFGTKGGKPADSLVKKHTYILQPVTGNAKYVKSQLDEYVGNHQPQQKASVNLDDVTLCLSKDGYRDILKLVENFAAFNQRLKYAHLRPLLPVKNNPTLWWKYAYRAVSDQTKKASGKLSWEQVLKYAKLRKKYISLYASLLKSDPTRATVDDNPEIEVLDRELDIDLILQWRMLAHKFVERSTDSAILSQKQQEKRPWWSFGRSKPAIKDENEALNFTVEDWDQLNRIIGYKEEDTDQLTVVNEKKDILHTLLEIHMKHNASKLIDELQECLASLSCENLDCIVRLYPEAKVFDVKLGSYQLSSPQGQLAESATASNSLLGIFSYKPFGTEVDWSMTAKASPCYMTYLKDPIDRVMKFFETDSDVSKKIAAETVAAMQMTIDEVKRAAQQQMNRALKDQLRFSLDLDIAAPKVTIPTDFRPDNIHPTQLLLDLGNLVINTKGDNEEESTEEMHTFLQFNMVLSDVSAFLVDGDFIWSQTNRSRFMNGSPSGGVALLPVIDRCGVIIKLEQNRLDNPEFPSTRVAMRLPSLSFHFSPARYHRLMQIIQLFQAEDNDASDVLHLWSQADLEGWLSLLVWKGIGNREAVWQRRYICLVGSFLYVLESPDSSTYKQYISLRGKQVLQVPADLVGTVENVLAVCDASRSSTKVVEDANALILKCDDYESQKLWQRRLQGAIYHASESAPISSLSEGSSDAEDSDGVYQERNGTNVEKLFITGVMNELKLCCYYNNQHDNNFLRVLLAEEGRLCEFRAIGGQVEISITENDMLIGTVLKTLEIEDLISSNNFSRSLYLARSFVNDADITAQFQDVKRREFHRDDRTSDGDDKFYEAPESLTDYVDSPLHSSGSASFNNAQLGSISRNLSLKPPSFRRAAGLLPHGNLQVNGKGYEQTDVLDSFVKAQIIIHDQSSPLYDNVDKKIVVTLATLSFFCRRPTILALMEFVNAINIKDDNSEYFSENSAGVEMKSDTLGEASSNRQVPEESVVKGILGKGKSRIVLNLTFRMARAQIFLMNEKEKKIATLSQDNLLADIKVFPLSFGINASLGNLKISDDSLPSNHMYYWICDMRNPGGSSFVELAFNSFNADDDDYGGYEYGLSGQLSEVRLVYLNRFIQEIAGYFTGLVPSNSQGVVKLKDQVTNSEKWFTASEFEGSPAIKLDISLRNPVILMPRQTNKSDYLKLDIVLITVQNCFQWLHGGKADINAVHLDTMTITIEDINLNVGMGSELGESIIQDVKGISIVIRRSLRDLLHQLPSTEVSIKMEELKAGLSNKEYQIISECALDNFSEASDIVPPLTGSVSSTVNLGHRASDIAPRVPEPESTVPDGGIWITTKVFVAIDLVELRLHAGAARDAPLATVQVGGLWLLYNSNVASESFLSASIGSFTVVDDREGTEEGLRLAIRNSNDINNNLVTSRKWRTSANDATYDTDVKPVPTMLILDANFSHSSTSMSLFIQRPHLLVALDFLLAVVEFFVPTVGNILADEDGERSLALILGDAIILDQSLYLQPSREFSLSPLRPLIVDDERYDLFVYDGQGGTLYLTDKQGHILSGPSMDAIIYVGNSKKLQFKNVVIMNGRYLDSCIVLGAGSSYSALKNDQVHLEEYHQHSSKSSKEIVKQVASQNTKVGRSVEFTFDFQAIGPELTFYNTSKDVGQSRSMILSNKLLHAQLDLFSRVILNGDAIDMKAKAVGFTMECNGIRILEPFDTTLDYSNASGKTTINLSTSDIYMNFSFSILRLFLAVEEDIMSFLRMTSKKITVICSEFDKVGTVQKREDKQTFVFWRARAPPGFAILGDYLTPMDKPPTKGVIAINSNFARVKRPIAFQLVWPKVSVGASSEEATGSSQMEVVSNSKVDCSVWFPIAPKGYVALGCAVSQGKEPPPLSSIYCVWASLLTPCSLRDCVTVCSSNMHPSTVALWRVNNSVGSFLPPDLPSGFVYGAYELRHIMFQSLDLCRASNTPEADLTLNRGGISQQGVASSGHHFESVDSFQFIWSNQGSNSRKQLSIWRPVVSPGMVYFGDIAIQGYGPPATCVILREDGDEDLFRVPLDFQLVGQIKKQKSMESISFWMPQAPPGYVALGCIASKNLPKPHDFSALRCIRSDMVSSDQFLEESLWDSSNAKLNTETFSIWTLGSDLGTFIIRGGFKKPPRRLALKLADPTVPSSSDDTIINATISTFSAAIFDDFGGLMVPLFNVSLSGLLFNQHGKAGYLSSSVGFSLDSRSYSDKHDAWEPLIEPADIFVRYLYDADAPAASQLRITSKGDLNLNASVSNCNMLLQAYSSWISLSEVHESGKNTSVATSAFGRGSVISINQKRDYFIIPRNRLGQDLFVRSTETKGLSSTVRMPSGDMKPLKVTVLKNMLNSHAKGKLGDNIRSMVTVLISEAEIPRVEGIFSHQYVVTVNITPVETLPEDSLLIKQSARTRGRTPECSQASEREVVNWSELFFFKVDSLDNYMVQLTVSTIGKGETVGLISAPLRQIAQTVTEDLEHSAYLEKLTWMDLYPVNPMENVEEKDCQKSNGRVRCAMLSLIRHEAENRGPSVDRGRSGFIQISPLKDGPWTTVRLNYAAPAAFWRFGNDVVASEVCLKNGDRYVDIRSLVTVKNSTDLALDICLKLVAAEDGAADISDSHGFKGIEVEDKKFHSDEYFETEVYDKNIGWVGYSSQPKSNNTGTHPFKESAEAPFPREGMDSWSLDITSVQTADGWVYAPDIESLKWPESHDSLTHVNYARQRKWVRRRQNLVDLMPAISLGQLSPGESFPLPLPALAHSGKYVLQMRPQSHGSEYSWSFRADKVKNSGRPKQQHNGLCVSALSESDVLLCCTQLTDGSNSGAQQVWFCVSIQQVVLAKDVKSNPIQDWSIEINPPLTLTNFLPCSAEFGVLEMQDREQLSACTRGTLDPGKPIKVHNIDVKEPVYLSLLPQGGWLQIHEAVLLSHPDEVPSRTLSLSSAHSGRIVQLILEQNSDRERPLAAKVVRVYAPYWFSIARCPPLTFRIIDMGGKKNTLHRIYHGKKKEAILQEISHEEFSDGYTIVSALNFNSMGISASLPGEEKFGPVNSLFSLGDMDGSLEVTVSDGEGRRMKLFISTKPCQHQSVPTKVISICPFTTFTNRVGQNIFIRLNNVDEAKVLRGSDSRASFLYRQDNGLEKLQVRLEDTKWSYPIQITKDDTVSLVLRTETGSRKILRAEIRGFEEGSRFIVVFRLGSASGPIRIENRTLGKISVRQSAFDDDCWIPIESLSTSNFCWEDPYGQKFLDAKFGGDCGSAIFKFDLEKAGLFPTGDGEMRIKLRVLETGNIKVAQFFDEGNASIEEHIEAGYNELSDVAMQRQSGLEIITVLGVVGVSFVDHTPKESLYLYLERVYMSYTMGYEKGATTRFKLILGYLQLDNQLPLTLMPVLLAPEHSNYLHHPVFKMTLTVSNQNPDGVVVYPYVYARVTEYWWRLNIHEPIIWALVDLYNNIRLDQVPQTPTVTQVDPEIRFNLIDISEIRLKVSLQTAPAQRPHGVLGVWSPILSAVGNAFKIQIHLRRVMHKDRFIRKSSIVPAIQNRIMRDLIHNPLHLLFSVDVLGMASSTLSSLSRGFAELSTDGQFLQLRSKQVRSRRITGVGDGILQGTEALAQGVAFGVSGVVTKPVESARQNGIVGLAHGVGQGFLGVILQPVSGALDFVSMTVGGIGASFSKCLEILNNKTSFQRIRNPRAIHADGIIRNYCEREACGQMILYLAEASRHFGCAEIFKEPSKFAGSDYYEEHFIVPYRRVFLVTNRRAILLQCQDMDQLDKKPCKIMWDVPWQELMALELVKAGFNRPSHLIFHLKTFQRSEHFVRVIKCFVEGDSEGLPQAIKICSVVRKMWKSYQTDSKCIILRVPSSQKHVYFACSEDDHMESHPVRGSIVRSRELSMSSSSSACMESRFVKHIINFDKIWSSEREPIGRCTLCRKQAGDDSGKCSIWRPDCPPGYVSIGDVARVGSHPPTCAAVYCYNDRHFALPVGYDLVWRNCLDDYANAVSIWLPRAPDGFVSLGCVAVAAFEEPKPDLVYCVAESLAEETEFESQKIWSEPESYPWACHIYQVHSEALHFVALRQSKDGYAWKPKRVCDRPPKDDPRTV